MGCFLVNNWPSFLEFSQQTSYSHSWRGIISFKDGPKLLQRFRSTLSVLVMRFHYLYAFHDREPLYDDEHEKQFFNK